MSAGDQGPRILWAMWVVTIVPCLIVALRFYCKYIHNKKFGWDDLIVVCSWVLLATYTTVITEAVRKGVGKHIEEISNGDLVMALKLTYIGEFVAIIACVLSKTSFAVTLLRIVIQRWQIVLLWFIIVSMNTVMWLTAIFYLAQCQPTAHLWDFSIEAKCWDPNVLTYFAIVAGAYSGLMDLVLALLPWFIIWKLQMRVREKVGVALAMSLGVFAFVTAMIKTSYLPNLSKQSDFTHYAGSILIWAAAETGSTIVAASIPSLRILVVKLRSSRNNSGGQKYSDNYKLSAQERGRSNKVTVFSGKFRGHDATAMRSRPDDRSDKSILGDSSGIKQTQIFTVTYENGSHSDDAGLAGDRYRESAYNEV